MTDLSTQSDLAADLDTMAAGGKSAPPSAKVSDVISHFAPTRRFGPSPNSKPYSVTSIDFDDTGELCLVARNDESIQIYNCKEGKHAKELKSQKYGVDIARFTHHPQSIIYASTKGDDAVRYLSSHDNSYIRYFKGHTAPVTCIALNPGTDEFITSSLDNTVRIWDLRSANFQGQLNANLPCICAYDPTAIVMAIACPAAQTILLYDSRNYESSPFATFELRGVEDAFAKYVASNNATMLGPNAASSIRPGNWTKMEFSNDGKKILLATNGPSHYLLDAFEGNLLAYCIRPAGPTNRESPSEYAALRERQQQQQNSSSTPSGGTGTGKETPDGSSSDKATGQGDACFSPDGRFVLSGSGEVGSLYVWDTESAQGQAAAKAPVIGTTNGSSGSVNAADVVPAKLLQPTADIGANSSNKAGVASVVSYNPRHNMVVTADRAVVFWLPEAE